jgi:CBS domain-containing protein
MRTLNKPLLSLTAGELMTTTVVGIPAAMSLQAAAHLLSQAGVSGAPVVDTEGRCIGVISAHDFMTWAEKGQRAAREHHPQTTCAYSAWQLMDIQSLPAEQVSQFMTCDPVTVRATTRIVDLAQKMLDAHIHRVIVVDPERRPIGVVSSTDVLAAVAYSEKHQPATGSRRTEW